MAQFINFYSDEEWKLDDIVDILTKVQQYAEKKGLKNVTLHSVEDNQWSDPDNKRFDIDIDYVNVNGIPIRQRLLFLKGEVLDGEEFHKRFEEFYERTGFSVRKGKR